jgi:hypothetical protein
MTATMAREADAYPATAPPVGRRNRWRLVAGALVVVAAAAGFAWYGTAAADLSPVLVVTRPVALGAPVTAGDIGVAEVRLGPGVQAMPGSQAGAVVGRPAAVPLWPGMLLAPEHVGPAAVPAAGEVLVAVAVALPPAGLAPGSRVRVLVTPGDGTAAGAAGPVDGDTAGLVTPQASATVVEVGPADGSGARVVSLLLPDGDGDRVAVAAATGRVSLVSEAVS